MFRTLDVCVVGAVCLLVSPVFGQEARVLRKMLVAIEARLQGLEEERKPGERVAEIVRGYFDPREPNIEPMIVCLYDLIDLFAVAPPYIAMHATDLRQCQRPLFPVVRAASSDSRSSGIMGRFGGMFNLKEDISTLPTDKRRTLNQSDGDSSKPARDNVASARNSVGDLVDVIQTTISTDEWEELGGDATIAQMDSSLLISASERMHRQIGALLKLFRKR